jgi:hypothetical protein
MSFDPMDHGDAKKKVTHGADLNRELAQSKDRASRLNPGRDTSALNAEKAKAEGWSKTDWQGWALERARGE